jgi:ABC-type nickel/cobalt efflux system permease component RcnA
MWRTLRVYVSIATGILLGAAVLFALLYQTLESPAQVTVRTEALKVLLQLVVIGIIGGFATWLLNERGKEQERAETRRHQTAARQETLNDFRRSAVARVVAATNVVRKAPLLIDAHRSKKTYGEQLRAILDAQLELALLRHEYESATVFTRWPQIREEINKMEQYLFTLIDEWRDKYQDIPPPPADAWTVLKELPALKDLRLAEQTSNFQLHYIHAHQEAIRLMRDDILRPQGEA